MRTTRSFFRFSFAPGRAAAWGAIATMAGLAASARARAEAPRQRAHLTYTLPAATFDESTAGGVAVLSADDLAGTEALRVGYAANGLVRKGAFSLLPLRRLSEQDSKTAGVASQGETGDGLRLVSDKSGLAWSLSACRGWNSCTARGEVSVGKSLEFSHAGTLWRLVANAPLGVVTGRSTVVRIPSWSLATRGRYSDGGSMGLPTRSVLVAKKGALEIVDLQTGHPWQRIELGSLDLGRVVEASFLEGSILSIRFEAAALVLDFTEDTALIARAGSIERVTGLARLSLATPETLWRVPGDAPKLSRPLAASTKMMAWDKGIVSLDTGSSGRAIVDFEPFENGILSARADADGNSLRILVASPNGLRETTYTRASGAIAKRAVVDSPVVHRDVGSYLFLDSGVLQKTTVGVYLLTPSGEKTTSLTGHEGPIVTDGHHGVLLQMKSGASCVWRHFEQHESVGEAFGETGVDVPCLPGSSRNEAPLLSGSRNETFVIHRTKSAWRVEGTRRLP